MTHLLLDGHNLVYRAFTTIPRAVVGADGLPINAVYGLVSTILQLVRAHDPESVVVAFDTPETPTFRHQLYPGYQAQRGPLGGEFADDFRRQVSIARQVLPAISIPTPQAPGFEADDIMATLAVRAADRQGQAIVVTTDRDLLQLVRPGIAIQVPGKTPLLISDDDGVRARLGIAASGVTGFKALAGDASDNIPGVASIGVKTAASLINQFGTLEAIYENLEELPARVAGALERQRDDAYLFRRIVTVRTDLELPADLMPAGRPRIDATTRVRAVLAAADALQQ